MVNGTSAASVIPGHVIVIKPEVEFMPEPQISLDDPNGQKVLPGSIHNKRPTAETVTSESVHKTHSVMESNSLQTVGQRITNNCAASTEESTVKSGCNTKLESVKEENEWKYSSEQVWNAPNGSEANLTISELEANLPAQGSCISNSIPQTMSASPGLNTSVHFNPSMITVTPRDISLTFPQSPESALSMLHVLDSAHAVKMEHCRAHPGGPSTGVQYDVEQSKTVWQIGGT